MASSRPLVIFTHFYPFGSRELFLEAEMPYLKEQFSEIIVVPNVIQGALRDMPPGVFVETSFAATYCGKSGRDQLKKSLRALTHAPFYTELRNIPKNLAAIKKLMGYSSEVVRAEKWLQSYLKKYPRLQTAVFYTYWFYDHTTAIGRMKAKYPGLSLVSRAHGFDLYEEDYAPGFIPFRASSLSSLDRLIFISEHGRGYLRTRFPEMAPKYTVAKLGIHDPGFCVSDREDATFTIVSCSHLVALKRLPLQIDGIASFARAHPDLSVEWVHVGDGSLKQEIEEYASKHFPSSVKWSFKGDLLNRQVFEIYREINPDVFIIVSETEGLPVSIMEALSCGIPVVATSVGGIPEIMNAENGILLSPHPTKEQVGEALRQIWTTSLQKNRRKAARQTWELQHRADVNYPLFANILSAF